MQIITTTATKPGEEEEESWVLAMGICCLKQEGPQEFSEGVTLEHAAEVAGRRGSSDPSIVTGCWVTYSETALRTLSAPHRALGSPRWLWGAEGRSQSPFSGVHSHHLKNNGLSSQPSVLSPPLGIYGSVGACPWLSQWCGDTAGRQWLRSGESESIVTYKGVQHCGSSCCMYPWSLCWEHWAKPSGGSCRELMANVSTSRLVGKRYFPSHIAMRQNHWSNNVGVSLRSLSLSLLFCLMHLVPLSVFLLCVFFFCCCIANYQKLKDWKRPCLSS